MAQTNTNVQVNITAESKQAKAAINDIARSLSALGKTAGSTSSGAKGLSSSVGDLTKGMAGGIIAAQAITMALNFVKQEFINCVNESVKFTNALIGLSSVSAAFGESQSTARDAAVSLAQDGLMSVTEAADGLKNLLATGFSLDEAIKLMNSFKDAAAFNRQGTLGFGEAIVGATQGLKNQNSIMVDNVGITKNLSNILKEAGLSVNDLGNVTSDAAVRQKLYNGLLKEASVFQGDAARAADTLGGQMSTLQTMFKMARVEVGNALSPALSALMTDFMRVSNIAGAVLLPAVKGVITIFYGAYTAARLLGNTISGLVATFIAIPEAIRTKSLDPLKQTFKVVGEDYGKILGGAGEDIADIWGGSISDVSRTAVEGLGDSSAAVSEKAAKLAKDLKKENADYIADLESMTKDFNESLNDMVFAHREKSNQLKADIASENKAYDKKMKERTDNYDDDIADMEVSHTDKTQSIKDDIAEEEAAMIISQNKLQAFQDDKYLTEINQSKAKLAILQSDLVKQNVAYDKQKSDLKTKYQLETESIKSEHGERLKSLQDELNVELALQVAYESEFTALKDKVKEDDITRLKRKFAEEKSEREKDHAERLAELYQSGASETAAYEAGKQNKSASDTSNSINQASNKAKTTATTVLGSIPLTNVGVGSAAPSSQGTGTSLFSSIGSIASSIGSAISSTFGNVVNWFSSNLPHFAEGGVVEGSIGQPVMAVVHAGEKIIPVGGNESNQSTVNNNITVNVGIYAGSEVEKRNLAMKLWSEIGRLASSQNKTPNELIGFTGA